MVLHFLKSGYQKIKAALQKTRSFLRDTIRSFFSGEISQETFDKLEQALYEADLGVEMAASLTEKARVLYRNERSCTPERLIELLEEEILKKLTPYTPPASATLPSPYVMLIVGVNGNGKTTTVAKLAHRLQGEGKTVLLGAGDTFRAAATEQLALWSTRLGVDCVKGLPKSDPASVLFDAIHAGIARNSDVVLLDTAGRLQNKVALMQELEKMHRVCSKALPGSPHEVLLVIDATNGQNAIDQARMFHKHTPLTGLIITKLDGSAKGGIVVRIQEELKIPIRFIGTGESIEDLAPFDPKEFVTALFQ